MNVSLWVLSHLKKKPWLQTQGIKGSKRGGEKAGETGWRKKNKNKRVSKCIFIPHHFHRGGVGEWRGGGRGYFSIYFF